MQFTASLRVRFTVVTTAQSCTTGSVPVDVVVDDFGNGTCPSGGYNYSTGAYCAGSRATFTIPQLPATACGNQGNAINSYFGLGVDGATLQIRGGTTSPVVQP
jgi:hypothetical protein